MSNIFKKFELSSDAFTEFQKFEKLSSTTGENYFTEKVFSDYSSSEQEFDFKWKNKESKVIEMLQSSRKKETKKEPEQKKTEPKKQEPKRKVEKIEKVENPNEKFSSLNQSEHIEFLNLEKSHLNSPLQDQNLSRYFMLRNRVIKEQQEFHQQQKEEALKEREKYLYINSNVLQTLEKVIEKKKSIVYEYPQFYKTIHEIDMKNIKSTKQDPILTQPELVLRLGICFTFEPLQKNFNFNLDREFYLNEKSDSIYYKKKFCPVVSKDLSIKEIIKNHKVNIVISSSTFLALIDTNFNKFPQEWCFPCKNESGIIFIDKPLLKKKYTVKEYNNLYYKQSILNHGLNIKPESPVIDFNKENSFYEKHKDFTSTIENFTYTIWTLGNLKILIRSKVNGVMPDYSKNTGYSFTGVRVKSEYQPDKGIEEFTWSELARNWAYSYIRSDTNVYVSRIDVKRNQLINTEKLSIESILSSSQFRPEQSIKLFYTILSEMMKLEPGNYLLRHYQNYERITIQKETEKVSSDYDLFSDYKNSGTIDQLNIPFVPFIWKGNLNQIPNTFRIKEDVKKNQNNKKKKKKTNQNNQSYSPKEPLSQIREFAPLGKFNESDQEWIKNENDIELIMKNCI